MFSTYVFVPTTFGKISRRKADSCKFPFACTCYQRLGVVWGSRVRCLASFPQGWAGVIDPGMHARTETRAGATQRNARTYARTHVGTHTRTQTHTRKHARGHAHAQSCVRTHLKADAPKGGSKCGDSTHPRPRGHGSALCSLYFRQICLPIWLYA